MAIVGNGGHGQRNTEPVAGKRQSPTLVCMLSVSRVDDRPRARVPKQIDQRIRIASDQGAPVDNDMREPTQRGRANARIQPTRIVSEQNEAGARRRRRLGRAACSDVEAFGAVPPAGRAERYRIAEVAMRGEAAHRLADGGQARWAVATVESAWLVAALVARQQG